MCIEQTNQRSLIDIRRWRFLRLCGGANTRQNDGHITEGDGSLVEHETAGDLLRANLQIRIDTRFQGMFEVLIEDCSGEQEQHGEGGGIPGCQLQAQAERNGST